MSISNVFNKQGFVTGLLAFGFFLSVDLVVTAYFNNIVVSWLMTVLLIIWVNTAMYSARNLRRFEGNDRWLLLVIAVFAPLVAFLIWNFGLGQIPDDDSAQPN